MAAVWLLYGCGRCSLAHCALVSACTDARWHCLGQQDYFPQVLNKLDRRDLAAVNLVNRSWHAGIHQQLARLELRPDVSLLPAADSGLSRFSALTSLSLRYSQQGAALPDRKQEYDRLVTALSTIPLRGLYVCDRAAAPSDCIALGRLIGLRRLEVSLAWPTPGTQQPSVKHTTLLPALSGLKSLRELRIFCSGEQDLAIAGRMSHLRGLDIRVHPDADLSTLWCLHHLTQLKLQGATAAQRRQLSGLTGLRHLSGMVLDGDRELSYLAPMAALTEMRASWHYSDDLRVDLAAMGSLRRLEGLSLSGVNHDMDFAPLSGLTALRNLSLLGTAAVDLQFLGRLSQLTKLLLQVAANQQPMHLSQLTPLVELSWHCDGVTTVSWLSRLTNLQFLDLETPMLSDLAPLSGLRKLRKLWLEGQMTSLHDLAGLQLDYLYLQNCSQLTSLSAVRCMARLRALDLVECAGTASCALSALTSLTCVHVSMTPLAEVQTL